MRLPTAAATVTGSAPGTAAGTPRCEGPVKTKQQTHVTVEPAGSAVTPASEDDFLSDRAGSLAACAPAAVVSAP